MHSLRAIFFTTILIPPLLCFADAGGAGKSKVTYTKAIYSLPVTLDPIRMNDGSSQVAGELIYEGLLRLNNDYGYEAALAESWSSSPDGKILSFKLRPNANFHNGEQVEAADVVASLTRALSKSSKVFSYYSCIAGSDEYHSGSASQVSGLRAIDTRTVQISLKKAFPPFLYVLAGATAKILPRHHINEAGFFTRPIGSGPFQFISLDKKTKRVILQRFAKHPRLRGNLDEIVLLAEEQEAALKLAEQGKMDDLANWPLNGTESVFNIGQRLNVQVAGTWIIGLNSRLAPFNALAVRKAFRDSFNAETFRKRFYPDAAPAAGYLPLGFPGSRENPLSDQVIAKANSKKPITIALPLGLANGPAIAQFLEASFERSGWNVSVKSLPWDELMNGYANKTLQAFIVNMNIDYPDSEFLLRNFESKNSDNFSGLKDPKLDALLEEARSTVDRSAREKLYFKAVEIVEAFVPSINLFHPRSHIWLSKCVQGLEPNLLSDVYIDYANVSIDQHCTESKGAL